VIAIVINPVAGGNASPVGGRVEAARRAAADAKEPTDIIVTESRGHARELTRAAVAHGARLVVAWGGDGTVNEVAAALASSAVPLGIVPAGSGNGLARALHLPRDPHQALLTALRGTPRRIDMGEIDGHPFVNLAGVGFDASVAAQFDEPRNVGRGFSTYARIVGRSLITYEPLRYTIATLDWRVDARALLVTFANGTQYGNNALIAPHARLDDGLLNLVIVEERSRLTTLAQVPRLFRGTIGQSPDCTTREIADASISCDTLMTYHVDGEPIVGGTTATVRVLPGVLTVAV
jgi:YegS/Rv2252/BmrU family lipid kinase